MNIHLRDAVEKERAGRLRYRLSSSGRNAIQLPYFQARRLLVEQRNVLEPLASTEVSLPSEEPSSAAEGDVGSASETRPSIAQQVGSICKAEPWFRAAQDELLGLLQVSDLASVADDATCTERIAVGRIYDQRGRRRVGVLATATGPTGGRLRLDLLEKYTFMTSTKEQTEDYVSWKMAAGRSGLWQPDDSTRIMQICFSTEAGSYGQFLAVRYQSSVAILRPEHRYNAVKFDGYLKSAKHPMPPSVFEFRPFATIHVDQLMGNTFAHAAFHPDKQQLALMDIQGYWAVWNYTYNHKTDLTIQAPPERGTPRFLSEDTRAKKTGLVTRYDGWSRLSWTGDGRFIFTARRRNAALWHLDGSIYRILPSTNLHLVGSERLGRDWILDVKSCPLRPRSIWVLTSHRVISLTVTTASMTTSNPKTEMVKVDLAERHYKSQEDVDWALEVVRFSSTIITIVRGKQNNPAWAHTFLVSNAKSDQKVIAGTSSVFRFGASNSKKSLAGICYIPVLQASDKIKDSFPSNFSAEGCLVSALLCSGTLAVTESLLSFQHQGVKRLPVVQVITRSRSSSAASGRSIDDDFVVSDGMVSDDPDELRPSYIKASDSRQLRLTAHQSQDDWRWLRAAIEATNSDNSGSIATTERPLARLQDIAEDASRGFFDIQPGSHILSEVLRLVDVHTMSQVEGQALMKIDEEMQSTDFEETLRGVLQNTFEGITTANDLNRAATLSTSALSTGGLSAYLASSLDNVPTLQRTIRKLLLSALPTSWQNRERLAQKYANNLASKALLSIHRLAVIVPRESLTKQDSIQGGVSESIESAGKKPEPPSSPASSLPPLPPSDDLYQPDLSLGAASAAPHPYCTLASLGVIGAVEGPVTSLNRVREQWKVGEKPTGFDWKLSETALQEQQTRPSTSKAIARRRQRDQGQETLGLASIRSTSAWAGSSQAGPSRPTSSHAASSQPRSAIQQSMRPPPMSAPQSSQFPSSQVSLGPSSQVRPSGLTKSGKKRKAGF